MPIANVSDGGWVTDWLGNDSGGFSDNLDHLSRPVDNSRQVQPDPALL